MDVIFYFVIASLIASVLCYFIFLIKNNMLRGDINKETQLLLTVGTDEQKSQEAEVVTYKSKIEDFSSLLKNHEFASNVFAFMEAQTMPNAWFSQFGLDSSSSTVQLAGESDDIDSVSRQVAIFEKNKYIKTMGALSTSLSATAKIQFNTNLTLDQKIFSYLSDITPTSVTTAPADQTPTKQTQSAAAPAKGQQATQAQSSEKLITSFHLLLTPEVIGTIDQTKYTINLSVPYGTDIKNLTPVIITSSGASVSPSFNVPQDFTGPATYIVTASDGSSQNYTVIVNVLPKPVAKNNNSGLVAMIAVLSVITAIIVVSIIFLLIWKRKQNQNTKLNDNLQI